MRTRRIESPMGPLDLFAEGGALIGLNFEGENTPRELDDEDAGDSESAADARVLDHAERELGEYFAGKRKVFTVKLAPRGTDFQMKVWKLLREIPFG